MGNCSSIQDDSETNWRFVGREADLQEVKLLISKNKKRSVLVYGMKKIGKTEFLQVLCRELCESKTCRWKDFELDNIESGRTLYKWCYEFLTMIGAQEEKEYFENVYPSKTIACNSCEKCQQPDKGNCLKRDDLLREAINTLISNAKKCENEIILFLDNIDKIMDSAIKDSFLDFHRKSLQCSKLRTVIASANKPKQTAKNYGSFELKPLDNDSILEVLFETSEKRNVDSDEEHSCSQSYRVTYSPEFRVFNMKNKEFIDAIVGLCEGLPLAAVMAGLLLTEDNNFYEPKDLVEILICMRLTGLSPENCPPDDRLDIYKNPLEEVKGVASFFNCLNENMTGTEFSIEEAVAAADESGEIGGTGAMVKHNILKKALDRSILSTQSSPEKQQLKWHGIFRECQHALQTIDELRGLDDAKHMVLKFMTENLKKSGLDIDEKVLSDPKALEEAIKSLSFKEKNTPPVQAKVDSGKVRMTVLEEHRLASKEVAASKYDTKQSSVVKVSKGLDHNKDVENNPEPASAAKKLATRYSVSEGSDSSDSDSVNLEFTAIDLGQTVDRSPPSYSSLQGPPEVRATRFNIQSDRNRYPFPTLTRQPAFNSFEEPPPSYTSVDPINHIRNIDSERNRPCVNETLPHMNPDLFSNNNSRSRSLPSVHRPNGVQQNTGEGLYREIYNRPSNNDRQVLQRAKSDPNYVMSENNAHGQFEDTPRRETDRSVSDSSTGPPALSYIPPSLQIPGTVSLGQSDRYDVIPTSENSNRNIEMQASSLRMAELKEPIPDPNVDTSDDNLGWSRFSTRRPVEMSWNSLNNDLYDDPGYVHQIPQTAFFQSDGRYSQFGEMPQVQGQSSGCRLSINQSKNDTNAKRRSPTAVVSPMPKRKSPPSVNKQLQQEESFPDVEPSEKSNVR